MGFVIQNCLETTKLSDAKPKDLRSILIKKGFLKKVIENGLSLRNVIRDLDGCDLLHFLPQVVA